MLIVTSEQMRNIDRRATEQYGIPSIVLMENAALAVIDVMLEKFRDADRVALFCGTGQNGGDGFAVARHLANRGVTPQIFVVGDAGRITGDARTNLEICRRMQLAVWHVDDEANVDEALAKAMNCDVIVDAIFGTGLTRAVDGLYRDVIEALPQLRLPIVAVDVPSGLSASSHKTIGPAVHADVTVTFAAPKIAHIFDPAASHCGEVVVADISIPEASLADEHIMLSLITIDDVLPVFPPRFAATHKGTYGHVAIHAGSEGRSGAAILAARGAVRAGAGLVTVFTDRDTAGLVDSASVESMTMVLDPDRALQQMIGDRDALLIGPGLPDDEAAHALTRRHLVDVTVPAVLDAQAVNAFAGRVEEIAALRMPRVLTPHPGELARLTGRSTGDINDDRITAAREVAGATRSVLVLKGHQTLVASPDGEVAVNTTGNPGMASGGMGDVLGGIIVALLARGIAPFDAARSAVYLHGFAGDMLLSEQGDTGLTANDLAERLPHAIQRLRA